MAVATRPANEPVSSGELQILDLERASEVERRHRVLAAYLDLQGDDALVIQRPSNFAWFTGGGDNLRPGSSEPTTSLFITREARVALSNSVDSLQVFDRELSGLGFQLKERPWDEPRQVLVQDLCRGRRVATDVASPGMRDASSELADFRRSLSDRELVVLRRLARMLTHAVEATARNLSVGDSEAEVAGQLAHRLMRHELTPVRVQVLADGQGRRYRNWSYGADCIERFCTISAVARMNGLHCGVTRTVCLGQPPNALLEAHQTASLVAASAFFFSQAGWESQQTWQRIERIYEKFDASEEWRSAEQGDITGYEAVELPFTPRTRIRLSTGTPIFWRPSVRIAAVGETILIHADRTEVLTKPEDWPQLSVNVKGMSVQVPDILIREVARERIRRP